jgi:hypothetical protein
MKVWAAAAALLLLDVTACSFGEVTDATTNGIVQGATVSFRMPNLSGSSTGDVVPSLGGSIPSKTWSSSDPGSNGAAGVFYLNWYGSPHLHSGDNPSLIVQPGWQRLFISKPGYDSRTIYHNHLMSACNVSVAQGPYSAGPYPFDSNYQNGPFWQPAQTGGQTICAGDVVSIYPSNTNYVKDADVIVDVRTLRDNVVSTTNCEGVASRCLRVSVGTANVGDGDLWLIGNSNSAGVTQRRFRRDGSTTDTALPNAVFAFHPQHHHIHLQNWTNLRLRKVTNSCSTEDTAANCPTTGVSGTKVSVCLEELGVFDSSYTPNPNRGGRTCDWNSTTGAINQGIGSGQEDIYVKELAGQLIGIDGLPSGQYWLEVEVNPANSNGQRTVLESDYNNNIARITVNL